MKITNFNKPCIDSIEQITFGCDPEFEVVYGGEPINLRYNNPHHFTSGRRGLRTQIGVDGAGAPLEIRPLPGKNETEIISNLQVLFKRIEKKNASLSVLGNSFAIGGHIHIGIGQRWCPETQFLQLLDYFIGKDFMELSGNARGHYAQLSAYEIKPYGFEYRTPSAAVFANPQICSIVFKIVRNLTKTYFESQEIEIENDFNGKATNNDLRLIGGLNDLEVAYYRNFIKSFKITTNYTESIIGAWVENMTRERITRQPRQPRINVLVNFNENDTFSSQLKTLLSRIKGYEGQQITFFGLAEFRGTNILSGIKMKGYRNILSVRNEGQKCFSIGLPYWIRTIDLNGTNEIAIQARLFIKKLIDAIQHKLYFNVH